MVACTAAWTRGRGRRCYLPHGLQAPDSGDAASRARTVPTDEQASGRSPSPLEMLGYDQPDDFHVLGVTPGANDHCGHQAVGCRDCHDPASPHPEQRTEDLIVHKIDEEAGDLRCPRTTM